MFGSIKRLILLGTLLLVGVAILLLMLQNPQRSEFHFLFWVTPELPFSVFLILAFVLGAVGSLLLSLLAARRWAIRTKPKAD
ncbi:LapA family protein [Pseudomonas sp. SO81]|uniref:LapA family protein n=1 Tax=Pseudomonas sp. SO81 TaxID=2983246 RepID=UPI0025A34A95|nr:LapA family protein [Pseudomonas sp. SO81]WJN61213.1 hypothetical protein OH686_20900 [Pseudomonas sp. SO81]